MEVFHSLSQRDGGSTAWNVVWSSSGSRALLSGEADEVHSDASSTKHSAHDPVQRRMEELLEQQAAFRSRFLAAAKLRYVLTNTNAY